MANQSDWKDPAERAYHGRDRREHVRRASDERYAAVVALGEWLIRRQSHPVLLVDENLTLMLANGAARDAIQKSGWLSQCDRRIEILDSALGKQLKGAVERWPKPRSDSIVLSASGKTIDFTRLKLGRHHLPKAYVITVLKPQNAPRSAKRVLGAAGLTELQSRVAVLIYEGASQSVVAEQLGVSVNTVKSHLKGIYEKAGVRSQQELTRWVGELLAQERE